MLFFVIRFRLKRPLQTYICPYLRPSTEMEVFVCATWVGAAPGAVSDAATVVSQTPTISDNSDLSDTPDTPEQSNGEKAEDEARDETNPPQSTSPTLPEGNGTRRP